MKQILPVLLLALSGCCAFTSRDCNCKPPEPELTQAVLNWMAPYQPSSLFVFEDDMGHVDTLALQRISDTDYCGGEECGADCQREIALLTSTANADLRCRIAAVLNTQLAVNGMEAGANLLHGSLDAVSERVYSSDTLSSAAFVSDYLWNGQKTKVLEFACKSGADCSKLPMTAIVVSREFGLIEYTTTDGRKWHKK